jgi:hypothetical protein
VQRGAYPNQHATADEIKQSLHGKEPGYEEGKTKEGRNTARGDDTVIDLEHEHGACQHEHVDCTAEQGHTDKSATAAPESTGKVGILRLRRAHHEHEPSIDD